MGKKYSRLDLILLATLPLLFALLLLEHPFLNADSSAWTYSELRTGQVTLTHFSSNALVTWALDPLVQALTYLPSFKIFFSSLLLLCGVGIFLLLGQLGRWPADRISNAAIALSLVGLLTLQLGADLIVWTSLAWVPLWLYFANLVSKQGGEGSTYLFSTFAFLMLTALAIYSSNLAALVLILIFALVTDPSFFRFGLRTYAYISVIVVSALYTIFYHPYSPFPVYPPQQFVVPTQNVLNAYVSSIGPEPIMPILNRIGFQDLFVAVSVLVLIFSAIILLTHVRRTVTLRSLRFLVVAALLATMVVLDSSIVPESVRTIMPLQTLQRCLPGTTFIPLTHILTAFSILLFGLGASSLSHGGLVSLTFCILGSLQSLYLPDTTRVNDKVVWQAFENSTDKERILPLIISPSYFVIKHFGPWILDMGRRDSAPKSLGLLAKDYKLAASAQPDMLKNLGDKRQRTRWSPGKGRQEGENEWLSVHFNQTQTFRELSLNSGNFVTDFPRGLRVRIGRGEACSSGAAREQLTIIFDQKRLIGSAEVTAAGYPYFRSGPDVRLHFEVPQVADCMLVEQIGIDPNYDWSLSEFQLFN